MINSRATLFCLSAFFLAACEPSGEMSASDEPAASAENGSSEAMPDAAEQEASTPIAQTTTQASLLSEPEWAILFAGHDLSSFNAVGDAEWNIIDDYVEADGYTGAFLVTRGHYTDFLLQAEFWPGANSNSGIFIRNGDPQAISAMGGYEINIYDTNENLDNRTGSIVGHVPPRTEVLTEEQWNTYEITAQGNRITVVLNGTRTAELEDDTHANGPIAFQNNGGLIRFRNIRLRPL